MTGVVQRDVIAADDGLRLDRWFRQHYPALGFGQLQKMLRTGQVRVDGARVKTSTRLVQGQTVRVPPLPTTKLDPARKSDRQRREEKSHTLNRAEISELRDRVLLRDDHVIAIDKPAGLAVQGGAGTTRHLDAMLHALRFEADEPPRLVHRLDRDTSGVMLLARSRKAAAVLAKSLQQREAEKLYWALVIGTPRPSDGIIDAALIKKGTSGREKMHVAEVDENGQRAQTIYDTVDFAGGRLAWLAFQPVTGRTHQIRAHAAAFGHVIVGDGKYGGADAHPGPPIARQLHLHARRLRLRHPVRGMIDVEAPLPEHMAETWGFLSFDPTREVEFLSREDKRR